MDDDFWEPGYYPFPEPPWGFAPLWCFFHNVAQAAACKLANENGWWDGAGYHRRSP